MGEPAAVETRTTSALVVWALASFHTALLVAAAVVVLYATGVAGDVLAGLGTAAGAVAYLYLWAVTWWTNRAMLERLDVDLVVERPAFRGPFHEALRWGGIAGLLVFLPLLVVGIVFFVGAGGVEAVPFLLIGAAIGTALSAGVGVLVGAVLVLVDLLLLRAARAWLPPVEVTAGDRHSRPVD